MGCTAACDHGAYRSGGICYTCEAGKSLYPLFNYCNVKATAVPTEPTAMDALQANGLPAHLNIATVAPQVSVALRRPITPSPASHPVTSTPLVDPRLALPLARVSTPLTRLFLQALAPRAHTYIRTVPGVCLATDVSVEPLTLVRLHPIGTFLETLSAPVPQTLLATLHLLITSTRSLAQTTPTLQAQTTIATWFQQATQ